MKHEDFPLRTLAFVIAILLLNTAQAEIKRTPSGKPDLSGVYDTGTLTPEQRPEFLGEIKYLYPWVADLLNWAAQTAYDYFQDDVSDADRGAPPAGGDGNNTAGAGGVGGYNAFYIDIGQTASQIDGKCLRQYCTTHPMVGVQPPWKGLTHEWETSTKVLFIRIRAPQLG